MNLGELKSNFRTLADDTQTPYRWSDTDLVTYLNEAELEACYRRRYLIDSTSAFTQVAVSAGTAVYALDSKILFIRRVIMASGTGQLGWASVRDMDRSRHGWESETGVVERFITGMDNDAPGKRVLRLYRIPSAPDTAKLVVVRSPASQMSLDADIPEIPEPDHFKLIDWALYRAYSNFDADTYNPELAQLHKTRFEEFFGTREQANLEEGALLGRQANRYPYADGTF